jgi:ribosomal protein S12 methylthiotransferase accessory factor
LRRYSSNSGTACGLSRDEALLHALLEVIERDSIGVELLRTIIRSEALPVREIRRSSVPTPIDQICTLVERETLGKITFWDITTEIMMPTILARLSLREDHVKSYFGSGSSLSVEYAMERSILESLQGFHANKAFGISLPFRTAGLEQEMTRYQRCFLESGVFNYRGGVVEVDYEDLPQPSRIWQGSDPQLQLNAVVRMLKAVGFRAYSRTIKSGRLCVVQVVVPQLERFFLVSVGIPVAPSKRGRGALS